MFSICDAIKADIIPEVFVGGVYQFLSFLFDIHVIKHFIL